MSDNGQQDIGSDERVETDGSGAAAETDPSSDVEQPSDVENSSVSDIFSRHDTQTAIKETFGLLTVLGVGYGLFGYFTVDAVIGAEEGAFADFGGILVAIVIIIVAALMAPLAAFVTSLRLEGTLADVEDNLVYATAAVGSALGAVGLTVLTALLASNPLPASLDIGLGDFTNLILLTAVVSAIVAAASGYLLRQIDEPAMAGR